MEQVEMTVENLRRKGELKGAFDAKKVKRIKRAWKKKQYASNAELIARYLFN